MHDVKVLYIASPSRSASTILEHTLGKVGGVANCGELRRLKSYYNEDKDIIRDPNNRASCTCGKRMRDCDFWMKVEKESGLDFSTVQLSSRLGSINRSLFKLMFFVFGPKAIKWLSMRFGFFKSELEIAENCFCIYSAISAITKSQCIVDSSKMIHQFLVLKVACPERVNLIFMVRDGRAVSKSMIRGDRGTFFKQGKYSSDLSSATQQSKIFKAAVLSWATSILQILVFYLRVPESSRYLIRYESFCANPDSVIKSVNSHFGIEGDSSESNYSNAQVHAVGGSPSQFCGSFKTIIADKKWRDCWTKKDNSIFRLYGALINKMLGYK
jgi:hypothetical protein